MVIQWNWLCKKFNVIGVTIWPFIFIKEDVYYKDTLIRHERIHFRQAIEMLVIPFYLWYIIEYCFRRRRNSHWDAYRNISFEKEANANESDPDFLSTRKFWNFIKYL